MTTVLVTGGAGYIGSTLVPMLLGRGYKVKVLDLCLYGEKSLDAVSDRITLIKKDTRFVGAAALDGVDAVVDMAAISNDPTGDLDPVATYDINWLGRVRIANMAKRGGVKRYILASSCSVYGFQDGMLKETSPTNPITAYAKCNVLWEKDTLNLSGKRFSVTALRQATVYGLSKRMRFDLAVNTMALSCFKGNSITIDGDGSQWRPFVHVKDTSMAFIAALESEEEKVKGETFNVGSNRQNYQIMELAGIVGANVGSAEMVKINFNMANRDTRSYKVSFDKVRQVLGFRPKYTPANGAAEIYHALESGAIKDELRMHTVNWLKQLNGKSGREVIW